MVTKMRNKRNRKNQIIPTGGYIKKYLGTDITRILATSNRNFKNCNMPYVHHEEAETFIEGALSRDIFEDKSKVLTGLTGSGKTTIIRHICKSENNLSNCVIDDNKIIILIDFNRPQVSADEALCSNLRAAIEKIVIKYKIDYPDYNNKNFYEFIKQTGADYLNYKKNLNLTTPFQDRMRVFDEKLPAVYSSYQLQYVMDSENCDLNLAVLIIDNVEASVNFQAKNSREKYLQPIISSFQIAECIQGRGISTKWSFNMLIACRHHIWRIIKGEFRDNSPENSLLQSYVTTEAPYDLVNPVRIDEIVKKREEVLRSNIRDPEKWDMAVQVVNTILEKIENDIGDFVLQLELKDIRKSMQKILELTLHKGLQKQSDDFIASGAFQINSVEQFDLSRVNLIRIIGLGDKKYYSDLTSIIPNLLYNEQQEGIELYVLIALKYFLKQCNYAEPTWDNSILISKFYESIAIIFNNDAHILSNFNFVIKYLIQHRLLLRSADQSQDDVPGLATEEIKLIEQVYVSGKSVKLWNELGKSSALFQLFLDDIWFEDDLDYFSDDGNNIEHCVTYLEYLIVVEKRIFYSVENISHDLAGFYLKEFGIMPVTKQLVYGLISSLEAISSSNDLNNQLRVRKAQDTLKKARSILNELEEWESERRNY